MDEQQRKQANEAAEKLTEVVQGYWEAVVERAAAQEAATLPLYRSMFETGVEALRAQAEINQSVLQNILALAQTHREVFQNLSTEALDAYDDFLNSLFSYYREAADQTERPVMAARERSASPRDDGFLALLDRMSSRFDLDEDEAMRLAVEEQHAFRRGRREGDRERP